ncbi:MAG TPA: GGDEF domain-containing protein [Marinospirillum sp.]|uniref:GGDEF domain-containing protein n=1 Tax=Marinospirillum sp. TaxID=2183934 RepID=UPI002B498DFA|nr:GGDEF domain-containing protein [Marinospirillum sp.]HKM15694.1 GGDEF domain-containing protein [Marinospirillum sp.]
MTLIVCIAILSAIFSVQRQVRQQEQQQNLAILEKQANKDMLTGINNRRYFYEQGELEIKRAVRHKTPLALLMLDADHFKKVNDTYGHAAGDLVLKDLTKTVLRKIDLFGRIGGEEFAVLLPNTHTNQALEIAERLRVKLAKQQVPLPKNGHIHYTVSIGLIMLTPERKQLDKLFQKADIALYKAKEQGRNCVVVYNKALEEKLD